MKEQNWYGNAYALTKKTIEADFLEIKNSGMNTISIYGPSVYDRTIFEVAGNQGLKIHYSFWVPDPKIFINDTTYLIQLAATIKQIVTKYKNNTSIVAWNIGNYTTQQLAGYYFKPELFYQQQAYIAWLKQLVQDIKVIDPTHPVTTDVEVSPTLKETVERLHDEIPQIDAYGLVLTNSLKDTAQIMQLTVPHYFSNAHAEAYFKCIDIT